MITSQFPELSDPNWQGFVIVSAEVGAPPPTTRRIRRIPKDVFFQALVGPQGPAGADGAPGAPGTNGTNGTNGTDALFAGRTMTGTPDQIDVVNGSGAGGNPTFSLATNAKRKQFGITIDNGGSVITTGFKGVVRLPASMIITGWEIVAGDGLTGSISIGVWKDTYANFPPTVADAIFGGFDPTITADTKAQNTSFGIVATVGDYVAFNVNSVTTLTRVHLAIFGELI